MQLVVNQLFAVYFVCYITQYVRGVTHYHQASSSVFGRAVKLDRDGVGVLG